MASTSDNTPSTNSSGSVKLLSIGILGLIGVTFMSSAFPPFFSTSTARAVINAPVVQITSPINGRVADVGGGVGGARLAKIVNDRVDRSTLIGLTIELSTQRDDLELKRTVVDDYSTRIKELVLDLDRQQAVTLVRATNALRDAQTKLQIAGYEAENQRAVTGRKQKLFSKGLVAGSRGEFANIIKLEDAKVKAAAQKVATLQTELADVRAGVFVDDAHDTLQLLKREIRTSKADRSAAQVQLSSASARIGQLQALAKAEGERVERLGAAEVRIAPSARLFRTTAQVGKEVGVGDSIAETISCSKAFVVAIFSERQAQSLAIGATVTVNADGWPRPLIGRVERLVPRTTEQVDRDYAVPFPPTERRELYAFIVPGDGVIDPVDRELFCSVGTWATVNRGFDWLEQARTGTKTVSYAIVQQVSDLWASLPSLATTQAHAERLLLPDDGKTSRIGAKGGN